MATYIKWYLPKKGEICDSLQCGGGRGEPMLKNMAGHPDYTSAGTITKSYTPPGGQPDE
jgi:hypothetical protein